MLFLATMGQQASAMDEVSDGVLSFSSPNPTIHYTFDSDLTDARGGSTLTLAAACPANPCNSVTSFGTDAHGKYWTWTSTSTLAGGGFSLLTNSEIGQNYTIAMKFSFSTVTGWRKIIDYKDRGTDEGFYYYSGKMQFYPGRTGNEIYPAGTVLDLVIVRDNGGTTGSFSDDTFTVYGVGAANTLTQLIQYNDTTGESIPFVAAGKTKLGFFYDDTAFTGEATLSGKVYDLRIWSNQSLATNALTSSVLRPGVVTGIVANPATQSITISWNAVSGATSYLANAGGQSCTAQAPATTCTILGLADGTSVTPTVQAIGDGGYSDVASASQSITVGSTTTTTTTSSTTSTTVPAPTTTSLAVTQTSTQIVATTLPATITNTTVGLTTRNLAGGDTVRSQVSAIRNGLPATGSNSQMTLVGLMLVLMGLLVAYFLQRRHVGTSN